MIELTVREPERDQVVIESQGPVITIGRSPESTVSLEDGSVSRNHAEIRRQNGGWIVRQFGRNGSFVDDEPVVSDAEIRDGARLRFGHNSYVQVAIDESGAVEESISEGVRFSDTTAYQLRRRIHKIFLDRMDTKYKKTEEMAPEELEAEVRTVMEKIIGELAEEIPEAIDREELIQDLLDDSLGLGPLEDFLDDPTVTEVMVNGQDRIYVERSGKITQTDNRFLSEELVVEAIHRIVGPLGRQINEASPMVDARLADGSRVNAIIRPLALCGPTITIRKFSTDRLQMNDIIELGSLSEEMASFLLFAVKHRQNVLISGGTGSGKTTFLNLLASAIPSDERIVSIEDAAELQLPQDHWVPLEHRPPNMEGSGEVAIRDLVRNSLRMRPDRIVVGEVRGGEALDMLQAMNTGHDGSLTTAHANSPRDLITRLTIMVLMAGMNLSAEAVEKMIASAIDVIVQQERLSDGTRKITKVSEVTGMEGNTVTMSEVFEYHPTGFDEKGRVLGEHRATGTIPRFVEKLRERGIEVDLSMFEPKNG